MLPVSVISPEMSLFEGEATSVVAAAFDGEVGILTGHARMMALLDKGELLIRSDAAEPRRFAIGGGFLQAVRDQVRAVTERGAATD